MFREVEKMAQAEGVPLKLYAYHDNYRAHNVYKNLGM